MQPALERGSIDKPLIFYISLIQLRFTPVCLPNTCNISVKLREGLHFSAFHLDMFFFMVITDPWNIGVVIV